MNKNIPVCGPGFIMEQLSSCPDLPNGVSVINLRQVGNQVWFILSNGSQIGPVNLPEGQQGDPGRNGNNGTNGANGVNGSSLMFSGPLVGGKIVSVVAASTGVQSLSSFSTDHTNPAKNLVNIGDIIRLYAYYGSGLVSTPDGNCYLTINGTGLPNVNLVIDAFGAGYGIQEFFCDVTLTDNTPGAMKIMYNAWFRRGVGGSIVSLSNFGQAPPATGQGGAGTDFSANNYTFAAFVNAPTANNMELVIFNAEKLSV